MNISLSLSGVCDDNFTTLLLLALLASCRSQYAGAVAASVSVEKRGLRPRVTPPPLYLSPSVGEAVEIPDVGGSLWRGETKHPNGPTYRMLFYAQASI